MRTLHEKILNEILLLIDKNPFGLRFVQFMHNYFGRYRITKIYTKILVKGFLLFNILAILFYQNANEIINWKIGSCLLIANVPFCLIVILGFISIIVKHSYLNKIKRKVGVSKYTMNKIVDELYKSGDIPIGY